jgi:hypothetical protein
MAAAGQAVSTENGDHGAGGPDRASVPDPAPEADGSVDLGERPDR